MRQSDAAQVDLWRAKRYKWPMNEREIWGEVHRRFDPQAPPARPEWRANRSYGGIYPLHERLRRPFDAHPKILVAGTVGAGKTTELLRLAEDRRERDLVVYFDVHHHLQTVVRDVAVINQIAPWEIAVLVGLAVGRALNETELAAPEHLEKIQAAWGALLPKRDVKRVDLAKLMGSMTLVISDVTGISALKTIAGLTKGFRWDREVGRVRHHEQDPAVQALFDAVNALLIKAAKRTNHRLVVLLDGLDRIQDAHHARALFVSSTFLTSLECALIVNAPFVMRHDAAFAEARGFTQHFLVNEPVLSAEAPADPSRPGDGLRFFRELTRKRMQDVEAQAGRQLIASDALDFLAWHSGGRARDFVHFIREAAGHTFSKTQPCITHEIAQVVANDRRRVLESGIRQSHVTALTQVMQAPRAPLPDADVVDELLTNGRLLPYPNDSEWFFPHPLLLPLLSR